MGVMEKIHSIQFSVKVKHLPQANQFAESSTSIN